MKIECLVAEIGSTTTVVNAFRVGNDPAFLGRGVSVTTVDTDVTEGLQVAIEDLRENLGADEISYDEMFATSSAAGGLRMTVSGLVYEMTVRAAREAALNAGANIHLITAGDLEEDDIERIKDIRPNIILISGGTDYGEKRTAFGNLKKVEQLALNIPIIYAGNVENHYRIGKYFAKSAQKPYLSIVENVYPRVDHLNIHPLRKKIYETFEKHIIHAKGMQHVKEMVKQGIMPTPGAVMEGTMHLHEILGNVAVIDVGGATTDVHSITHPSEEFAPYSEGEAKEKRTVEGDLGVFLNHRKVMDHVGEQWFHKRLKKTPEDFEELLAGYAQIPSNDEERRFVKELARVCVFQALDRHIGDLRDVYTSGGRKVIPEGRDLTRIQSIVLTGGALVHLENTQDIVKEYLKNRPKKLVPKGGVRILKDHDYILASLGVLSLKHPEATATLLKHTLRIGED